MNVEIQKERRPLPAGIQTFRRLREKGCYYVDKTPLIRQMIEEGDFYFLSRPRRFGKSLLVSTLKELIEGNEPLFQGLDIHSHWDWSIKYPVVRLSFGGKVSIIKSSEDHIRFLFVIGITMFSKTSFSSGLNNLTNISLSPRYATICGYTDHDLDTVFAPELEGLDRDKIRTWYNGYHWLGTEKLYNPHDILHLFYEREYTEHWFQSGEPGYLYRMLEKNRVSPMQLENRIVVASSVSKFVLDKFSHEALLFQSGYLTIKEKEVKEDNILYRLDYPNYEVQRSFNLGFADHLTGCGRVIMEAGNVLIQALAENNFSAFKENIQPMFKGIPYAWSSSGGLERYESWYASLLSMSFRTTRVDLKAEEMSGHGRSDLVILHENQIFVLEFKMVEDSESKERKVEEGLDEAITQIREKAMPRSIKALINLSI